jgi:hypothetical protein
MVLDLARVITVVRAVDVYWVTVWRMLVVEILRVTELVVRLVRVAGVAVVAIHVRGVVCWGSHWRTGNGPDAEHWPVVV